MRLRNLKVYWDKNDWWWGYYRGDEHHYLIIPPVFCLVFSWDRKFKHKYGLFQGLDPKINEIFRAAYEDRLKEALADRNYKYFQTIYPKKDGKSVVFPIRTFDKPNIVTDKDKPDPDVWGVNPS